MSRKSIRKGQRGARDAADILQIAFPDVRARVTGEEGQDSQHGVSTGRDLDGTPGYCVQVNLSAEPRIAPKLKEAMAASVKGEIAVALTRKSSNVAKGEPWIASMLADDFVSVVASLGALQTEDGPEWGKPEDDAGQPSTAAVQKARERVEELTAQVELRQHTQADAYIVLLDRLSVAARERESVRPKLESLPLTVMCDLLNAIERAAGQPVTHAPF